MRRALVDDSGRVVDVVDVGAEFPVHESLKWVPAAEHVKPGAAEFDKHAKTFSDIARVAVPLTHTDWAVTYLLEPGDTIPRHKHDEATVHTSLIAHGTVTLEREKEIRTLVEGDKVEFVAGEEHQFTAVTRAIVVNVNKGK